MTNPSKVTTGYKPSVDRCAVCAHFAPASENNSKGAYRGPLCTKASFPCRPVGWCKLFEAAAKKA